MTITVLQIIGLFLVVLGGYGFYKNQIEWSFSLNFGRPKKSGTVNVDLSPEFELNSGVLTGRWVRPVCASVFLIGIILVFFLKGDTAAIAF